MDANYCFWNGLTMRSCCAALRTMSRYLQRCTTMGEKIMYTCVCNWVPIQKKKKKRKELWFAPKKQHLKLSTI